MQPLPVNQGHVDSANLRILQRSDPAVAKVLGRAAHSVVYRFLLETTEWERHGAEGPLFIVQRHSSPRFRLTLLNRLSPAAFDVDLVGNFLVKDMDPYVMFRVHGHERAEVYGLWFHDSVERQSIFNVLQQLRQTSSTVSETSLAVPVGSSSSMMSDALLNALRPDQAKARAIEEQAVEKRETLLTPSMVLGGRYSGKVIDPVDNEAVMDALKLLGDSHDFCKAARASVRS